MWPSLQSQPPKINIAGRALMSWFTCSNRSKLNCVCHPPAGRFKGWHLASLTPQGTIVIVREFMSSRSHSSISDEWYDDGERAHPQPPDQQKKTKPAASDPVISSPVFRVRRWHSIHFWFVVCSRRRARKVGARRIRRWLLNICMQTRYMKTHGDFNDTTI
jgi:hypothetical protein